MPPSSAGGFHFNAQPSLCTSDIFSGPSGFPGLSKIKKKKDIKLISYVRLHIIYVPNTVMSKVASSLPESFSALIIYDPVCDLSATDIEILVL